MRKDDSRTPAKKKAAAALRAQSAAAAATPIDVSAPPTPAKNGDIETMSRRSPSPMKDEDDLRAISPVSTASSASEPPLAQKVKLNGAAHKSGTPRSSGAKETKGSVKPVTPRERVDTPVVKEEKKSMTPKVKSENGGGGPEGSPASSVHAPNSTSEVPTPVNPVVSERFL